MMAQMKLFEERKSFQFWWIYIHLLAEKKEEFEDVCVAWLRGEFENDGFDIALGGAVFLKWSNPIFQHFKHIRRWDKD